MVLTRLVLMIGLMVFIGASSATQSEPKHNGNTSVSRQVFAEKLRRVRLGMTSEKVRFVLGRPDQVLAKDKIEMTEASAKAWCYGAENAEGFPTLGRIYFDSKERVTEIVGTRGKYLAQLRESEEQVREALIAINRSPTLNGSTFDSVGLIRCVNLLHSYGARWSVALLQEYLDITPMWRYDDRNRVSIVIRVLFEPLPGESRLPNIGCGEIMPITTAGSYSLPRFPVMLVNDMPLLMAIGYNGPIGHDADDDIRRVVACGAFRIKPLRPLDDPTAIVDALKGLNNCPPEARWNSRSKEGIPILAKESQFYALRGVMMNQIARATRRTHEMKSNAMGNWISLGLGERREWETLCSLCRRKGIRWDPSVCDFVSSEAQRK